MPAATLAPRRAPVADAPTPASAAALEARLLRAYRQHLKRVNQEEMDALVLATLGPARPVKPINRRAQADEREESLDERVPELLLLLQPHEQTALAPLLLEQHDLAAFARGILALNGKGNNLKRRELEPKLDDTHLFKAAGLGKISRGIWCGPNWVASRQAAGLSTGRIATGGPPLVLVPPPATPMLRTRRKARRRPPLVLRGQYSIWPPVSA